MNKAILESALSDVRAIAKREHLTLDEIEASKNFGIDISRGLERDGFWIIPMDGDPSYAFDIGDTASGGIKLPTADPRDNVRKFEKDLKHDLQGLIKDFAE